MGIKFANNGSSSLAGALAAGATTLNVASTEGGKFPTLGAGDYFMATLVKLVSGAEVREIIKVTARSADTMTIVRAQEGTTATTFSAGDRIENRVTAGSLTGEFTRLESYTTSEIARVEAEIGTGSIDRAALHAAMISF